METSRFLSHLEDEFALLRAAVGAGDLATRVPSCPEWTVADLAQHVGYVYLHKAESIRLGVSPKPWPPETVQPGSVALLDEMYATLTGTFEGRAPGDHAATWHEPDQTVGFWIRRMTQETVIHRVDAELALGGDVSPVPGDLAFDGVDEMLKLFMGYGSVVWREDYGTLLDAPDERVVTVATGHHAWSVRATPKGIEVQEAATGFDGDALVSGEPAPLLLWLWNRTGDDAVRLSGDPALLTQFHTLRTAATQ
ncbi:maleylpyruvate isomerase family mycothiol-dependent enzyme [Sphaerisporangium aureirubrum]|uniref:Maleylpyruvate isomerase family mycothiol-dependent enzyme n=1 Tax=Sphaerisporangium aureirubrum TaxID=1544736 RepID=A0ABW1NGM1_9ACTN